MLQELHAPHVLDCTGEELDAVISNTHTHDNKADLDAIGTAALRDVGTEIGNVVLVEDVANALEDKVDKVTGKGLSTEDYTTAEKTKLAGIEAGATNYVHPATHPSTMITGLGTAAAKDTGTSAGNVPVLGSDGKLADEVLPEIPSPTIVYNGLDSESTTDALSAAQGKMLADQIDGLTASDITYEGTDLNSALLTLDSRVLAAQTDAQGALAGITSLQTTIGDIGTILDSINGEVV